MCITNSCKVYNASSELLQQITTSAALSEGIGPLAVFTCNDSTTAGGFTPYSGSTWGAVRNMKLYRFTVREEGQVVCDLVPGVRNDGVACLLDAANNWHPLFNCGTGDFTYGSVTNSIPEP